jgi:hypothetical protein
MLAVVVKPFLCMLYDIFIPQRDESFARIFRRCLHAILIGCIIVVVSQQLSHIYDVYGQKEREFIRATEDYTDEDCAVYRGTSQVRIKKCSEDHIIMNSWPMARAISHVIKGWNTCLYMPCNELAKNIAEQLQYKIAFILLALALSSYLFNFFGCAKRKSKQFYEEFRYRETMKDLERQKQQQYYPDTTIHFASDVKKQQ